MTVLARTKTYFPSCLLELDARGRRAYVSHGEIESQSEILAGFGQPIGRKLDSKLSFRDRFIFVDGQSISEICKT